MKHTPTTRSLLVIDNAAILSNNEVRLNIAMTAASQHLKFIELLEYEDGTNRTDAKTYDTLILWYDDHSITKEDIRNIHDFLLKHGCLLDMESLRLITDHQDFADETASFAPIFALDSNRTLDLLSTNIEDIESFLTQFGDVNPYNRHSLQHAVILKDDGHLYHNSGEVKLYEKAGVENLYVPMGWQAIDSGATRGTNFCEDVILYRRRRPLKMVLQQAKSYENLDSSKIDSVNAEAFSNPKGKKACKNGYFTGLKAGKETVSNTAMGSPNVGIDADTSDELCLSGLSQFESLRSLQGKSNNLIIGFDSEWVDTSDEKFEENALSFGRKMLSWQFAVIDGTDLVEYVFIKRCENIGNRDSDMSVETALGRILDDLGAPTIKRDDAYRYECITGFDSRGIAKTAVYSKRRDAEDNAAYCYQNGMPVRVPSTAAKSCDGAYQYSTVRRVRAWSGSDNVSVTLVAHNAKADISTFNQDGAYCKNILRYLTEAQGGLFTTQPIVMGIGSLRRKSQGSYLYPVSLSIRDSMCSAPADAKKLADLGRTIGVPKVELPAGFSKDRMDTFMECDLPSYMDYASTDAVIALLYTSSIYGINREQPPTLLSAGTKIIRDLIADEMGVSSTAEFNAAYRGIKSVVTGKKKSSSGVGFYEEKDFEAVNDAARLLQDIAPLAYHGGYNSCSEVGYYSDTTYDFDLQNAYPTAMCLVESIDWDNCILDEYKPGSTLSMDDFIGVDGKLNICAPIMANVSFKFPDGVKYPCLPVNIEGVPVFLKSSEGISGVYVCGPELYLALRLGAEITVHRGFKARARTDADGNIQYSLRSAVKQLVNDRQEAKHMFGKGSLEELILKLFVNGAYGKVAQSVKRRSRWSAFHDEMEEIGISPITSGGFAAMITSIIRAVLLAAQNQIDALGHKVYSVTTDGFISDIPEDELRQLDLYGFREKMGEARLFLTDGCDPEIWEMKHMQRDLLNFTTRGNVSLNTGMPPKPTHGEGTFIHIWNPMFTLPGVCAHNGAKTGFESDSFEDRLVLMLQVLTRNGPIMSTCTTQTSFKDMAKGFMPFRTNTVTSKIHMDFDMKRKPVRSSFETVRPVVAGIECEICNFTTEPFASIEEYRKFRDTKKDMQSAPNDGEPGDRSLRTIQRMETFMDKTIYQGTGAKPRDMAFDKLKNIVSGVHAGLWDVPYLSRKDISRAAKVSFINDVAAELEMNCKPFTIADLGNAQRPARMKHILPQEYLADILAYMQEKSAQLLSEDAAG